MSAKITALAELTTIAVGDWIPVVDVSDTSMAPTGTDKRISPPNLVGGLTITASTGTLTIANGKTFTSSNTLTLAGTDGSTLNIGAGGTLGTSAYITLGANVGTALAVAVGSAGAFVTFNGALGTPSSGTVTNLTGTASININGTVGATTPAAGLFTTIGGTGAATILSATAIPAGGTTGSGYKFSSTSNFGLFFGSGAPTLSAARGSVYYRSDGAPYYNTDGGTTWSLISAAGSGDVVGPGSATDNAIVRFDSTTGKLIQDSAVTITDTTGNISTPGSVSAGVGGSVAGTMELAQGTAPSTGTTSVKIYAPTSVTSYTLRTFASAPTSGVVLATTTSTDTVLSTSATLAVANGGTGLASGTSGGVLAYTASGTLASSGALTANAIVIGGGAGVAPSTTTTGTGVLTLLGVAANGSTSDGPGYRGIPQNSQTAAYTTVMADNGKEIFHPSSDNNARTFTIDSNANVAYPIGAVIKFKNMAATAATIAITSDTMTLLPAGTTGSRTLAQYGEAVAEKISSTAWTISGNSALT